MSVSDHIAIKKRISLLTDPNNSNNQNNTTSCTQQDLLKSTLGGLGASDDYVWEDLICPFTVSSTGSSKPSYGTIFGLFEGYLFSANAMNQVMCDFHIRHDIAMGKLIYPHIHWIPTTNSSGTVRWGIEYRIAKGHDQGTESDFDTSTTVYLEHTLVAGDIKSLRHIVSEVSIADAIDSSRIEPDSVIKMRIFRDGAHANDTYPSSVHAWQADLHYMRQRLGSKNKAPNFFE